MKKLFTILSLFAAISANSQGLRPLQLVADSIKMYSNGSSGATLQIKNQTKDTKGFLYNIGNGITVFKQGAIRIDSNHIVIGNDTIYLPISFSSSGIDSMAHVAALALKINYTDSSGGMEGSFYISTTNSTNTVLHYMGCALDYDRTFFNEYTNQDFIQTNFNLTSVAMYRSEIPSSYLGGNRRLGRTGIPDTVFFHLRPGYYGGGTSTHYFKVAAKPGGKPYASQRFILHDNYLNTDTDLTSSFNTEIAVFDGPGAEAGMIASPGYLFNTDAGIAGTTGDRFYLLVYEAKPIYVTPYYFDTHTTPGGSTDTTSLSNRIDQKMDSIKSNYNNTRTLSYKNGVVVDSTGVLEGSGGGGISSLGTGYALTSPNDSTYNADTSILVNKTFLTAWNNIYGSKWTDVTGGYIRRNSRVGINIDPTEALDVNGNIQIQSPNALYILGPSGYSSYTGDAVYNSNGYEIKYRNGATVTTAIKVNTTTGNLNIGGGGDDVVSKLQVNGSGIFTGGVKTSQGGLNGLGTNPFVTTNYVQSRLENLITNGNGLLGNNYNFSGFTFDGSEVYSGGGSFRYTANNPAYSSVFADEFIPVTPTKKYSLSMFGKSGNTGGGSYDAANTQYLGFAVYDIDKIAISPLDIMKFTGSTDTYLATDLNNGDLVINLVNATGWCNLGPGAGGEDYARGITWFGYTNSFGYTYPNFTYSKNHNGGTALWSAGGITGNTITLITPWAGGFKASGTAVRNTTAGGTFHYLYTAGIPNTWTNYSFLTDGLDTGGTNLSTLIPYGAAYVKLLWLPNVGATTGNTVRFSGIEFKEYDPTKALDADVVHKTGNETINGIKTFTSSIAGSITGNAATATNLTGLTTSVATLNNVSGTNTGDQTSVTGNAGTVTNGLYSTGSYADPSWLTSLAWSKISSKPTTISGYDITDAYTKAEVHQRIADSLNANAITAGYGTNLTGAVLTTDLAVTDSSAKKAIILTTTGTSGAATYNNTTGVLNIPSYAGGGTDILPLANTFTNTNIHKGIATTDSPTFGSELTTTGSGTNWTGSGFGTGYTHTTTSTVALTTSTAAVSGSYYQITYTVTGRTAGTFTITFGGVTSSSISASGNWGPKATSTGTLSITPTTDFDGMVQLSIKEIFASVALWTMQNSLGGVINEFRADSNKTNILQGSSAGRFLTTATDITALGHFAASSTTTGTNMVAIGNYAFTSNTTGGLGVAIGPSAFSDNTTGNGNTGVGFNAGNKNTTGAYNNAFGYQAIYNNLTGNFNTGISRQAIGNITSGDYNIGIGYQAGHYITDGSTANAVSNNSIFLGSSAKALASNQTNQIVIGHSTIGLGSNTTVLGNSSTLTSKIYGITGLGYGANVASGAAITATGNLFHVTGTTTITSINGTNLVSGATITIIFDGVLTFTDGSNLKLAGNFTTAADATITLVYDGTNFYETDRSTN